MAVIQVIDEGMRYEMLRRFGMVFFLGACGVGAPDRSMSSEANIRQGESAAFVVGEPLDRAATSLEVDTSDRVGVRAAAVCEAACPDGYTCGTDGVCDNVGDNALAIDVRSTLVESELRVNGVRAGDASFVLEKEDGWKRPGSGQSWFYPGTYRAKNLRFVRSGDNFTPTVASGPSFRVPVDGARLVWDLRTARVSGTVWINGKPPAYQCRSGYLALTLVGPNGSFPQALACPANDSDAVTFSGTAVPGTYALSVSAYQAYQAAAGNVVVSGDTTGIRATSNEVSVFGALSFGNARPVCSEFGAGITLTSKSSGFKSYLNFDCDQRSGRASVSGIAAPGDYTAMLGLRTSASLQHNARTIDDVTLTTANASNLLVGVSTYAVSGVVTKNQTSLACGNRAFAGHVAFDSESAHYQFDVQCAPAGSFAGRVGPGTYRVTYHGAYIALPDVVLAKALEVGAANANLRFDANLIALTGAARFRAEKTDAAWQCAGRNELLALLTLVDADTKEEHRIEANCRSEDPIGVPTFAAIVPAGRYRVLAENYRGGLNRLANEGGLWLSDTNVTLDFVGKRVTGTVVWNGANGAEACVAGQDYERGLVWFTNSFGESFKTSVWCPDVAGQPARFFGWLSPGTYRVMFGYHEGPIGFLAYPKLRIR